MKTIVALFVTLILAAVSASALAMPCGQATKSSSEALDSQHLMRLHVAEQSPVTLKRPGKPIRLDV
jgi:ABC-type phosphate/phosphonate transport system substrate-binding protein